MQEPKTKSKSAKAMCREISPETIKVGEAMLSNGESAKGLRHFKDLYGSCPDNIDVLINLGIAAIQTGDYELGVDAHTRAFVLDPTNDVVRNNIAALSSNAVLSDRLMHRLYEFRQGGELALDEIQEVSSLLNSSQAPSAGPKHRSAAGTLNGLTPEIDNTLVEEPGLSSRDMQGDAFFCLSTGRCGTQTLTGILNTATNARVYHHPNPYLIQETLAAYHNQISASEVFWLGRKKYILDAWRDGLVFGGMDHNMTAFAHAIASDICESKFIVLVRNPWISYALECVELFTRKIPGMPADCGRSLIIRTRTAGSPCLRLRRFAGSGTIPIDVYASLWRVFQMTESTLFGSRIWFPTFWS